jgi:CSLREA domain-containing protein
MSSHAARRLARLLLSYGLCLGWEATGRAADLTVTTLSNADNGADSVCTLREAITAANTNANYHECTSLTAYGDDTITFAVSGTIPLSSTLLAITDPAGLTIDGTGQS